MVVNETNIPRFATQTPTVLNIDNSNVLAITLPILNSGEASAENLQVTNITLQSISPISPLGFPVHIGNFATGNTVKISAQFDSGMLTIGNSYLLTVNGVYTFLGVMHGFTVNRQLVIPPLSASPVNYLDASIEVEVGGGFWTYTIYNNEPTTSSQFVAAFSLDIVAPCIVTNTPSGWEVETDNSSFVLWTVSNGAPTYEGQIAPNNHLSGFQIQSSNVGSESTGFIVTSWDHVTDNVGLVYPGLVFSPSRNT